MLHADQILQSSVLMLLLSTSPSQFQSLRPEPVGQCGKNTLGRHERGLESSQLAKINVRYHFGLA